jgi:hypothetical protein
MAGNLEIDEDGLVKAAVGIRGVVGRADRVKHLVNRAAAAAEITMRANVPNEKTAEPTGGFERAIGRERAEFRPGGAGGGGSWTAVVGVQRTAETTRNGYSYPTNVFQGTGIYGPRGRAIKASPGNLMIFPVKTHFGNTINSIVTGGQRGYVSTKGVIKTTEVLGQKPQREWYDQGIDRARLIISSNLHRVFNVNDPMGDI